MRVCVMRVCMCAHMHMFVVCVHVCVCIIIIIMEICKASTMQLKALNKYTHSRE